MAAITEFFEIFANNLRDAIDPNATVSPNPDWGSKVHVALFFQNTRNCDAEIEYGC